MRRISAIAVSFWLLLCNGAAAECRRIITLSPALTEIAFALGLDEKIVGISRFVDHPAEAAAKTTVGGLLDPHIERIVALQPDTVFAQREQDASLEPLRRLDIPVLIHDHQSIQGILASIQAVGDRCGVAPKAKHLVDEARAVIDSVTAQRPVKVVRVMVVIAEDAGASVGGAFWVSGRDGFYSELLTIAGGTNINAGRTVGMATLSMEGVLSMAPDVVFMVATPGVAAENVVKSFLRSWEKLFPGVPAPQVRGFEGSYAWVPGPRFVTLLREVQAALNESETLPAPKESNRSSTP